MGGHAKEVLSLVPPKQRWASTAPTESVPQWRLIQKNIHKDHTETTEHATTKCRSRSSMEHTGHAES